MRREARLNRLRAGNEKLRRRNENLRRHVAELVALQRNEKPDTAGAKSDLLSIEQVPPTQNFFQPHPPSANEITLHAKNTGNADTRQT
jgi:hypothetical protein